LQKGFTRLLADDESVFIEDLLSDANKLKNISNLEILIDRGSVNKEDEENTFRIADSVQTAFFESEGDCKVHIVNKSIVGFSDRFELDGMNFEIPSANLFSFNNPFGACRNCDGFGHVLGIDEDLVIPNRDLSVFDGAIAPWRSEKMQEWQVPLIKNGIRFDFPIHRAIADLDEKEMELLWTGNKYFKGLNDFFQYLESQTHKIQYRVCLAAIGAEQFVRTVKVHEYVKMQGM
jgi:excinuclease ABC subunit A